MTPMTPTYISIAFIVEQRFSLLAHISSQFKAILMFDNRFGLVSNEWQKHLFHKLYSIQFKNSLISLDFIVRHYSTSFVLKAIIINKLFRIAENAIGCEVWLYRASICKSSSSLSSSPLWWFSFIFYVINCLDNILDYILYLLDNRMDWCWWTCLSVSVY